jgi:hypothetical protein
MHSISDPTIYFSVYLLKHPPESAENERTKVLRQVDVFIEKYGLQPYVPKKRPYGRASDIDLRKLSTSTEGFQILLQCHTQYPESREGTYYECLVFAYHDALILQVMISKFEDWSGSFDEGWRALTEILDSCFDGIPLRASQRETFGVSVVYWAIADSHSEIGAQQEEFRAVAGDIELSQAATDVGAPLWHCERQMFRDCPELSQDLWMMITPRHAEPRVNPRFYQPRTNSPADFIIMALARHKIAYERTEYLLERQGAKRIQDDLERRVREIVDTQRRLGPELEELRSQSAVQFQRKLAEAGAVLADYGQSVGLLKELRRTVVINQRTFAIHSVALISTRGADEVARSVDQEGAAARFLAKSHRDEIFVPETSGFQGLCIQLDSEIDYGTALAERHMRSLSSARDQLRIAGERELGEIAHHLSIDSAAVVASVVAVLVLEMIVTPSRIDTDVIGIGRWFLALGLIVGSFALTQILSSGCRGKQLERGSAAVAAGLMGAFFANWYLTSGHLPFLTGIHFHHLHEIIAFSAGMLLGWYGQLRIKKYRKRFSLQRS